HVLNVPFGFSTALLKTSPSNPIFELNDDDSGSSRLDVDMINALTNANNSLISKNNNKSQSREAESIDPTEVPVDRKPSKFDLYTLRDRETRLLEHPRKPEPGSESPNPPMYKENSSLTSLINQCWAREENIASQSVKPSETELGQEGCSNREE